MRVAWEDDKKQSMASIGSWFISISHATWYRRSYEVSIRQMPSLDDFLASKETEESAWTRFPITEETLNEAGIPSYRHLDRVKELAIEKARELGAKRKYKRRDYDEEWIAQMTESMLEELGGAKKRLERDQSYSIRHPITEYGLSIGYFMDLYNEDRAGHYLGRDRSKTEIKKAVEMIIRRLEKAGKIEVLYDQAGKRSWMLS